MTDEEKQLVEMLNKRIDNLEKEKEKYLQNDFQYVAAIVMLKAIITSKQKEIDTLTDTIESLTNINKSLVDFLGEDKE